MRKHKNKKYGVGAAAGKLEDWKRLRSKKTLITWALPSAMIMHLRNCSDGEYHYLAEISVSGAGTE